ncbi:MAG TPA: hypothetical protein VN521_06215 [Negativicutes bacterium]|nr:hypothetical protein [Negativicutes bacterium]
MVNNAATPYDAELTEKMTVWVERKFSGVYNLKPPAPFAAKLREIGASDLNGTKNAGIGEIFRPEGVDYVVYMELKPLTVHGHVAFFRYGKGVTADILLRMFDVAGGRYLYDAIVSQKAAKDEQSVFLDERIIALFSVNSKAIALDALDKSLFLAGEVISVKLPLDPRTIE